MHQVPPPQKRTLAIYFYIEVVGDLAGAAASSLLAQLREVCTQTKVLGTYVVERADA